MKSSKKNPDFNELLIDLEKIVERLGDNETSLEASLEAFEKGITLSRQAKKLLSEAEQRVLKLTATENGEIKLDNFEEEEPE
jgi:exodeoxyribonuclease VII small subunit